MSSAPSTSKPACSKPSDMPPAPQKRSIARGLILFGIILLLCSEHALQLFNKPHPWHFSTKRNCWAINGIQATQTLVK